MDIGTIGIWTPAAFMTGPGGINTAAELDKLGYGALWLGSARGDLQLAEDLLRATSAIIIATGIINIWTEPADIVAESYHRLISEHPGRFLLGIGTGHREHNGDVAVRPLQGLESYLDALDTAVRPVPPDHRILAALGPKVLELAAQRSAGAHPYLTTVEHTRQARDILGAAAVLAPELMVVLERDPETARSLARRRLTDYLQMRNYVQNLRRLGFGDDDLADGGSDRLVDALVAWGDEARIASRAQEHLNAGANHVCLQVLTPKGADVLETYRRLAATIPP
ncbi:MAG: TIGR03620 family F420-dependent LLM class oxidoreductase [Jatrophihabitans sp.]